MRKWGILISAFYAFILLVLIVPGVVFLVGPDFSDHALRDTYGDWLVWITVLIVLSAQALLLFLSVD